MIFYSWLRATSLMFYVRYKDAPLPALCVILPILSSSTLRKKVLNSISWHFNLSLMVCKAIPWLKSRSRNLCYDASLSHPPQLKRHNIIRLRRDSKRTFESLKYRRVCGTRDVRNIRLFGYGLISQREKNYVSASSNHQSNRAIEKEIGLQRTWHHWRRPL